MNYFVNGIKNSKEDALSVANMISEITGKNINIVNNETIRIDQDLAKAVNGYTLEQVLLANVLMNSAKEGDVLNNNFISHSRGNIDMYKAMEILADHGINLNNNVNIINVAVPGSTGDENVFDSIDFWKPYVGLKKDPVASEKILEMEERAGANVLGIYNNKNDIVTWDPNKQAAVAGVVLVAGGAGLGAGAKALGAGAKMVLSAAGGAFFGGNPDLNLSNGLNSIKGIGSGIGSNLINAGKGAIVAATGMLPSFAVTQDLKWCHTIDNYLSETSKVLDSKSSGTTGHNLYTDLKNLDKNINLIRDKNLAKIKAKKA